MQLEFVIFSATLIAVALAHKQAFWAALFGLIVLVVYKLLFTGFRYGVGWHGLWLQFGHEWVLLVNLLGLLVGFALLAKHFEHSNVPAFLPKLLPDNRLGAFSLLVLIFVLSAFLDNIAAALIGGTVARIVFRRKVHVGYLVAIVAAANAGGAGSVIGDTTTTMMWISGVRPIEVLHAYVAAIVALIVFAIPATWQQHAYSPIQANPSKKIHIDWARLGIVAAILMAMIISNVLVNMQFSFLAEVFPVIGAVVWLVLLLSAPIRQPAWATVPAALKGSLFLLCLVFSASMMPLEQLPPASWQTAFGLGFFSSVFDNIPLTALAIKQGGYDWGFLAYAAGFGGSMIWFGSSAGVALSNMFEEAKSVERWLRHGWHVVLAYILGFFTLLAVLGWNP